MTAPVATQATADTTDQRSVLRSSFVPGTWHCTEGPLEAALADVADRCPDLLPLADFLLPRLPRSLLCSNNLKSDKASSRYMRMNRAVRRKWMGMQARGQERINALVVDCDGPNWRAELDALVARGLPTPTFVVRSPVRTRGNKRTGKVTQDRDHETAHLYWVLRFPVRKDSPKAYDLFRRTRDGLVALLDADAAAAGHLGKNPFHASYVTEVGPLVPVELLDLCRPMQAWSEEGEYFLPPRTVSRDGGPRYLPGRPRVAAPAAPLGGEEAAQWGRLFEARHGIYAARARDYALILVMVEEYAAAVGSRATPGDMRDTARSIHRFMTRTYAGAGNRPGIDHGAMTREAVERGDRDGWVALDKTSKRVLAAERTNAVRSGGAAAALAAAVARLWDDERPITQAAVASMAGLALRTVELHWGRSFSAPDPDPRSYQGFTQGCPLGPGGGRPHLTLREISALSKERARVARHRAEQEARAAEARAAEEARQAARAEEEAAAYRELAAAMRRPGAVPQPVPPCPAGSRPVVQAARAEAVAAHRDARRRLGARRDRAAQRLDAKERRESFAEWARAGDVEAWRAWMAGKAEWWDRVGEAATGDGPQARAQVRMRRAVAFQRYEAEWDDAVRAAALTDEGRAARAAIRAVPIPSQRAGYRRGDPVRSAMDALDRIAAAMTPAPEELTARAVRERAKARMPGPVGSGARDPAEMLLSPRERFRRHLTP